MMWPPTESATITYDAGTETDALNNVVPAWTEECTVAVVVAPESGSDVTDNNRPDGTRAALTLHFPDTYTASLRNKRVVLRGRTWRVLGDPEPYAQGTNGYNRPVRVEVVEG